MTDFNSYVTHKDFEGFLKAEFWVVVPDEVAAVKLLNSRGYKVFKTNSSEAVVPVPGHKYFSTYEEMRKQFLEKFEAAMLEAEVEDLLVRFKKD